jgi:hypothetical protein
MSGWAKWFWFLVFIWVMIHQGIALTTENGSLLTLQTINSFALAVTAVSIGWFIFSKIAADARDHNGN